MNYLIPTVFLISSIGIIAYIVKERYNDLHKDSCDCNWSDSTKNVECDKCRVV